MNYKIIQRGDIAVSFVEGSGFIGLNGKGWTFTATETKVPEDWTDENLEAAATEAIAEYNRLFNL